MPTLWSDIVYEVITQKWGWRKTNLLYACCMEERRDSLQRKMLGKCWRERHESKLFLEEESFIIFYPSSLFLTVLCFSNIQVNNIINNTNVTKNIQCKINILQKKTYFIFFWCFKCLKLRKKTLSYTVCPSACLCKKRTYVFTNLLKNVRKNKTYKTKINILQKRNIFETIFGPSSASSFKNN